MDIKIDDDCFLNVDDFLDSLSYRKFHYYGRRLWRDIGQTDRFWHQGKSTSNYARNSFDRSPEPSSYADGGGGYTLSRSAVNQLLLNAKSEDGYNLICDSYLEDKLVGDLLSFSGINVNDEDYTSYQKRRTFPKAVPVGRWDNLFYPSKIADTKMVHLDRTIDCYSVQEGLKKNLLLPHKIWPSFIDPNFIYHVDGWVPPVTYII